MKMFTSCRYFFLRCNKIVYLNDVLNYYRQNPTGIVKSNSIKSNFDFMEALQTQYLKIMQKMAGFASLCGRFNVPRFIYDMGESG